ncbi:kynureninase [Nocardioides acrostichi]|uniref:Kynureninase n=1 Tax=Nocardioides acrostichi TaxID=2784339 RepID=A0A930UY28_9ACTN|nr:aminotransferase class V-fold PLP-dependent enzyme [Nocardioides acrostichi]MBF4160366.1 aminotransferase class V-fold PLP-dependent enzyme [Nocardioides acrostichi]
MTPAERRDSRDSADPLAPHRARFVGSESPLVYLDGNSLGRPLRVTAQRLHAFVEGPWGERLIRGWDDAWMDLPLHVGDRIAAACLGAAPGQTTVGDSTTVLLYKALRATVGMRPDRTEIVAYADDFPTDRYVAASVADECGLALRWLEADPTGGVTPEQVAAVTSERTAVVLLSHVGYRSAWLADMAAITRVAHGAGALALWDLSHSVGSVPLALDACEVDLAVGCTYKYLNGGPGSPAFVYAATRHHEHLVQPITGWMGHADPFTMGPDWRPDPGIRRMISGTPPIVGMLAMQDMLDLLDDVGMAAVRAKSVALTEHAIEVADEVLAPLGVEVASPRDPERRGGHVTLQHPAMREVVAALWQRDVLPDYRDPGGLRLGLSPLSTSFAEVSRGLETARDLLADLTA